MKAVSIVGARPQFIKAAPLLREFARRRINHRLVHTGQHYHRLMSQVFFDELRLPEPDYHLGVGSESHAVQTARMMARLEPILEAEKPDWVVVFGDTNSTLAGALTAAKMHQPVAHVEAGLRSFNRSMPEEINRIVADHVAALLLAPTPMAQANLAAEGVTANVRLVGDLMIDLARQTAAELPELPDVISHLDLAGKRYALATVHRAANTDDPEAFGRILSGLRRLPVPVIFPVHPRAATLAASNGKVADDNLVFVEPVSYVDMVALARGARVVLTDSGGLQKEAVVLGVPCVTLRDETEWLETLEQGWNALAGTDPDAIHRLAMRPAPSQPARFFGADGRCAERIADALAESIELRQPSLAVAAR